MSTPIGDDPGPSTSQDRESSQGGTLPKKGILKRPSLKQQAEQRDTVFPLLGTYRQSPDRFPEKPGTKIPKLSVTWWEKNVIAIFGDTSDENNTDSDQNMLNDLGGVSRIRQTAILDSEDEGEGPMTSESEDRPTGMRRPIPLGKISNGMVGVASDPVIMQQSPSSHEGTPDLEDEDGECIMEASINGDDMMSIGSAGSGGSSIVGRWWVGKDTRFVPHCVKRGCKHNHGDVGEYLTPTQRKAKEVMELKKELRRALQERDEKDRHLVEMRKKLEQIEQMKDSNSLMSEHHRLMSSQKEALAAFEKEKKQMEKRHAVRVNQLVHETMAAREEITKLSGRVQELEHRYIRTTAEAETMTEAVTTITVQSEGLYSQTTFQAIECATPLSVTGPMSPVQSLPDMTSPRPISSPMSLSVDAKTPIYLSQEHLSQMQAYQNEAYIWRNKAAQLEIIVKEQLLKASQQESTLSQEMENLKRECNRLRDLVNERTDGIMIDSGIDAPPSPQRDMTTSECHFTQCIERKKNLIHENNALIETTEEMTVRIKELEEDISGLRRDLEVLDEQRKKQKQQVENAVRDSDEKGAESAAAHIVIARLQAEKETMQRAISYMEERMTAYQNAILNNDLVVQDEETHNWRKGFANPKYIVSMSKKSQTTLTSEALNKHQDEFDSVQQKLKAIHEEFSAKRSDLSSRFEEIERNLLTKTTLVETLSKQLEDVRKDQRTELERHQEERETYKRSLTEVGEIAERVPSLEQRIEQLSKEKGEFDLRFKKAQEDFEHGLEAALSEALKKYQEQSQYWKDRVHNYEGQINKLKNDIAQAQREKDEMKMKCRLEKAELEHRLTSSIDHVSALNRKINKTKCDVEVEARPRQTSKYVACRPNTKSKGTDIEKGDLFDEQEERLKLCQGELSTTRRQVHTLQQKLITLMQDKADRSRSRGRIACVLDKESLATSAESQPRQMKESALSEVDESTLRILQQRNVELVEKLDQVEIEKDSLVREERGRIQQLVAEFDNVRKELDQEICRYESEKKWLKSRIHNLEKANSELEKQLLPKSKEPSPSAAESAHHKDLPEGPSKRERLRKILSEPDLSIDIEDDEVRQLKAEIARLNRELMRMHDRITRTASAASEASRRSKRSQLSPVFHNLVDDINMVKGDLEKILVRIDEKGATSFANGDADDKSEHSEEVLQSEVLERVVCEWDKEERTNLARDLARSRLERECQKKQIDRLHQELTEARNELELLRKEPRDDSTSKRKLKKVKRSKSTLELTDTVSADKEECRRWQEKAGTMFRELNRMRADYTQVLKERRELLIQLAMQRGELELVRIQLAEKQQADPTSLLSHSVIMNSTGTHLIKEMSVPLQVGSTDYRLTQRTTPQGSQILVSTDKENMDGQVSKEKLKGNLKATASAKDLREKSSRSSSKSRRAQSVRPLASSPGKNSVRTKSSSRFESSPGYQTAKQSMSSLHSRSEPDLFEDVQIPTCSMSMSWTAPKDDSDSQISLKKHHRTVPLRDKVKDLARENRKLTEKLAELQKEKEKVVVPVQVVVPNKSSQIELLEKENERLQTENKRLKTIPSPLPPRPLRNGSSSSLDAEVPRLGDEKNQLRDQIRVLENKLKASRAPVSSEQLHKLTLENENLSQENVNLRTNLLEQCASRREETVKETTTHIVTTQTNEEDLRKKVDELEKKLQLMSENNNNDSDNLLQEKVKAQKECKLLRERIEGLERHMQTEKEHLIAEFNKRVEVLERGRKNVLQENTLMMNKMESMGQELEKKQQQITKLEKENAYIAEDNRCLRAKVSSMEDNFKEKQRTLTEDLSLNIQSLEEETAKIKRDLEEAIANAKEATESLKKITSENKTLIEANSWLTKENETLKENIDDLKEQQKERQQTVQLVIPKKSTLMESMQKEKDDLQEDNEKLNEKLEALKKQLKEEHDKLPQDVILKLELVKREKSMYEKKIREMEEERSDMYLVMFRKGQQAVQFAEKDDRVIDQLTEDRITLRFLRDAFFYYLLNRGDEKDHLNAIMTMLDFTSEQKDEVSRKRKTPDRK